MDTVSELQQWTYNRFHVVFGTAYNPSTEKLFFIFRLKAAFHLGLIYELRGVCYAVFVNIRVHFLSF